MHIVPLEILGADRPLSLYNSDYLRLLDIKVIYLSVEINTIKHLFAAICITYIFWHYWKNLSKSRFFTYFCHNCFICRFHQNKKKIGTVTWTICNNFFFHFFPHLMNFIFLVLALNLKTKIDCRTPKSATNDANILVDCISNPKNIYFEVCMVR